MRKTLLLLISGILLQLGAIAQNPGKLSLTLEMGPTLSDVYIESEAREYDPKIGHNVAIGLLYRIDSTFSVKLSVGTERKGGQQFITFTDDAGNITYDHGIIHHNQDFLVVPLLLRANFGKERRHFANVGPYAGFLTNSAYRSNRRDFYLEDTQFYKTLDLGVSAGFGTTYHISPSLNLTAELRYNLGFSKGFDDPDLEFIKWQHRSVALLVGIHYSFHSN